MVELPVKEGVCLLLNVQAVHLTQQFLHLLVLILLFEAHGPRLDSRCGGVVLRALVVRMVTILSVVAGVIATRVTFMGVIRAMSIAQPSVMMGVKFIAGVPAMRVAVALVIVVPSTVMGVGGTSMIEAKIGVWVRVRIGIIPCLVVVVESLLDGAVELSIGEVISCRLENVLELIGSVTGVVRTHGKDPARQDFSVFMVEAFEELGVVRLIRETAHRAERVSQFQELAIVPHDIFFVAHSIFTGLADEFSEVPLGDPSGS